MYPDKYKEVAIKYHVEDLAGALIPGTRLSNILKHLELGRPISDIDQEFLRSRGLLALLNYARKELAFAEFSKAAKVQQSERALGAEAKVRKERAEEKLKEQARLARLWQIREQSAAEKCAFDNDPKTIAEVRLAKLREKYGLNHSIERSCFPTLMKILHLVDDGVRLSEEEFVWLTTEGRHYYTMELRVRFHRNEAEFYAGEFEKSKDNWLAVNASSHYRKCMKSKTADLMLSTIDVFSLKDVKLKSAICTTHAGVKRDLHKMDEALGLGEEAHRLTPQNFRPCTLLGAVNYEVGHHELGRSWYEKAVERGYSEKSVDDDLRSIFMRAEKSKREALRDHLLKMDPDRYSWAKKKSGKKPHGSH